MTEDADKPVVQRADVRRNRAGLLAAAAEAFASTDDPTLDAIAKRAGVGIATLYRHFPTRQALVEAVYRSELTRLCDSAEELLAGSEPDVALRKWMGGWSTFVAAKRGMADALQALAAQGSVTKSQTGAQLTTAIQTILDAGAATGTFRPEIRADDVVAALTGILLVAGAPGQEAQAARLLDLLLSGLRS